jgi:hypothetical protein
MASDSISSCKGIALSCINTIHSLNLVWDGRVSDGKMVIYYGNKTMHYKAFVM